MLDVGAIGDATIVRINEDLDLVSAPRLEHVIRTIEVSDARRVIVSLEKCPFCDSTCLGIVLRAANRIGTRLGVVVPPGTPARRLFEISGLVGEPFVFASVDQALAVATYPRTR